MLSMEMLDVVIRNVIIVGRCLLGLLMVCCMDELNVVKRVRLVMVGIMVMGVSIMRVVNVVEKFLSMR